MSDQSGRVGHAGTAYLQHIRDQLAEQRSRKTSIDRRGQTSVTTSGGLVALLLAFSDLGVLDLEQSATAQTGVVLAIVFLVLGAIAGVMAAVPADYEETKVRGMRAWIDKDEWSRSAQVGERSVAKATLDVIESAKTANQTKARWLIGAVALQALAVAVIAATVTVLVTSS